MSYVTQEIFGLQIPPHPPKKEKTKAQILKMLRSYIFPKSCTS